MNRILTLLLTSILSCYAGSESLTLIPSEKEITAVYRELSMNPIVAALDAAAIKLSYLPTISDDMAAVCIMNVHCKERLSLITIGTLGTSVFCEKTDFLDCVASQRCTVAEFKMVYNDRAKLFSQHLKDIGVPEIEVKLAHQALKTLSDALVLTIIWTDYL